MVVVGVDGCLLGGDSRVRPRAGQKERRNQLKHFGTSLLEEVYSPGLIVGIPVEWFPTETDPLVTEGDVLSPVYD